MNAVDIQIVEYGSELYEKAIELRYTVLRKPLGLVYTPEQLADERDEIHIVALQETEVVGVLVLKVINEQILKMRQVAVAESLQQQGIGKRLVLFSEQYAKMHNYKEIELHARAVAKDFYHNLYYKTEGDVFTEVGIPHYKMKKIIN